MLGNFSDYHSTISRTYLFFALPAAALNMVRMQVAISDNVIEFPRKFAEHEMDVELTEKLMGELSGIFNWALEGYKRLEGIQAIFYNITPINNKFLSIIRGQENFNLLPL